MAQVLETLTEKKIIHADLKPDNILIDFDGQNLTGLKLIDFGSAFSF